MTDSSPTIFADTVVGARVRKPGLIYVALGCDGFERNEKETVIRLVLPHDTANVLAGMLIDTLQTIGGSAVEKRLSALSEQATDNRRSMLQHGLLTMALDMFVKRLATRLKGAPDFETTFAETREQAVRDLKNTVTQGASIEDEAEAFRQAIERFEQMLDGIAAHVRKYDE